MTESPLLRDVLKDEWGFDGVVMSDWGAARSLDAAPRRAGPRDARPVRPLGRRARRGRARRRRRRVRRRRQGRCACCAWPSASARSTPAHAAAPPTSAPRVARPSRPSCAPPRPRRSCSRATTASLLPLTARTLRRVAVIGPNAAVARTLGGGSATVFPPYTVSPLDGLRAALPARGDHLLARRPRAHAAAGRRRQRGAAVPRRRRRAARQRAARDRRVHVAGDARPGGRGDRGPHDDHRRARRRARHRLLRRGPLSCSRSTASEALRRARSRCAPDADPGEMLFAPPQHGVPVTLAAGQELAVVLTPLRRADDGGMASRSSSTSRRRSADDELERAVALARDADVAIVVVGTTPEVESRGLRPLVARAARPPGRARPRASTTPTRRRSWSSTRARRCCMPWLGERSRRAAHLVPRPGGGQRARRRDPRRGRARRPPARPPGRRPRTACRASRPSTACWPTTRG